ncbi:MAG TPA: class I SAM-dependent methyltransferase [Candidatus Dormibacteraeota bacterium]|nr:class I SAM-dependent methyltransferase [Candidatus Dormibacteraeota bacterium]
MTDSHRLAGGPTIDASGEPTGERFVPELMGGGLLEVEHQVRYRFAAQAANGRSVLDAGCGVGWGLVVLLEGGASDGTGLDLSADAVAEARARLPGVVVIEGDVCALPPELGRYGLVTCFEVLEHIEDYSAGLDALVGALGPDGILMVSSPNPAVYPPGNPFHVHELTPEALVQEVAARLPHTALWRQRAVVGSLLRLEGQRANWPDITGLERLHALPNVDDGRDQYSVVVGSPVPLPPLDGVGVLTSSEQLDHLAELSKVLEHDRAAVWADHQRIVDERQRLLDDLELLRTHAATLESAEAAATRRSVTQRRREAELLEELSQLRRELDRVSLLLLESEQETAAYVMADLHDPSQRAPT